MKIFSSAVILALAAVTVAQTEAQNITDFGVNAGYGPGVDPGNTWIYNGSTSTVSGTNTSGNVLFGTFNPEVDFSGSNQITLTATANGGAPGSSFLFTLVGQSGATASAVFSWESFLGGSTQVANLTPIVPSTMQNANYWQIVSLYKDAGSPLPIDVTFSTASATSGILPAAGISGPILTGFGSAASSTGSWTYTPGTSTISGTTSYGDSITGNSNLTNYGSSPTQISLTASASVAQGTPFTYVLTDNTGDHAYAAFNWANFNGGVKTVTSQLTADTFFDPTNVTGWQILSGASNASVTATLYGAAAVSANAVTVLDNFTVAAPDLNNSAGPNSAVSTVSIAGYANATRVAQTQVNGGGPDNATAQLGGGVLSLAGTGAQSGVSLTYSGFNLCAPEQTFLRLDFNSAANLDFLTIELLSLTGSSGPLGGVFSIASSGAPQSFIVDLKTLSGFTPEFMAGINQITLAFLTNQSIFLAELNQVSFTSVPEPSTYALVLLGLIAVLVGHRNFRRAGR